MKIEQRSSLPPRYHLTSGSLRLDGIDLAGSRWSRVQLKRLAGMLQNVLVNFRLLTGRDHGLRIIFTASEPPERDLLCEHNEDGSELTVYLDQPPRVMFEHLPLGLSLWLADRTSLYRQLLSFLAPRLQKVRSDSAEIMENGGITLLEHFAANRGVIFESRLVLDLLFSLLQMNFQLVDRQLTAYRLLQPYPIPRDLVLADTRSAMDEVDQSVRACCYGSADHPWDNLRSLSLIALLHKKLGHPEMNKKCLAMIDGDFGRHLALIEAADLGLVATLFDPRFQAARQGFKLIFGSLSMATEHYYDQMDRVL